MKNNKRRWIEAQEKERDFWANLDLDEEKERKGKIRLIPKSINLTDKIILDVGCGPRGVIHFIKKAKKKIGLDPLVNEFKKRYGLDKKTEFIRGKGEEIPLKSESVDVVFCINVLDHTENPYLCLKEMARVLKQEGHFFFAINIYAFPLYLSHLIRERLNLFKDIEHPRSFTLQKIKTMLARFFKIENCKIVNNFSKFKTYYFYCRKK